MKVLVLYPTDNQISLIKGCINHLLPHGIDVFALNSNTWDYYCSSEAVFKSEISYVRKWSFLMKKTLVRKAVYHCRIATNVIVGGLFSQFDVIDYNFHSSQYDFLVKFGCRKGKKQIMSIWGSDFYRVENDVRERRRNTYNLVNAIHVETVNVAKDFCSYYGDYDNKTIACNYGIDLIEIICRIQMEGLHMGAECGFPAKDEKILVSCGYNSRRGQQHNIMIEAIDSLPDDYKKRIFLIFPMTYSSDDSVIDEVVARLNELDVQSVCITDRLDDESLAKLRVSTDIVLNTQITDAFSSSLMEYFYAGSVMLLGDWLPYAFLRENHHLFFISTSVANLRHNLMDAIDNIADYKVKSSHNKERVYSLCSWTHVAQRLSFMYKSIC